MGTSIDFFSPSSLLLPPGLLRPPESTPHAPLAGDRHYPHFSLLSRRIKLSDVTGGRFDVQASLTEADFFFGQSLQPSCYIGGPDLLPPRRYVFYKLSMG